MGSLSVRVLQRNDQSDIYNIERELYFKELAHVIVGADKSEICTRVLKAGNEVRFDVKSLTLKSVGQGSLAGNSGRVFMLHT